MAKSIEHIVDQIYETTSGQAWVVPLKSLEQHLSCGHVVLTQYDDKLCIDVPIGSDGRVLATKYLEQYAPLNHAWPRLMRHVPGEPVTDAMLLDMEAHRRSIFYNEFLRPNGLVFMAGCVLHCAPDRRAGIGLSRPAQGTPFTDHDLRTLQSFVGHLSRALRLANRLGRAEHTANAAWEILEYLKVGIVVVDAQARLIKANHAAEAILRSADGLSLRQGRITADAATRTILLSTIIRRSNPRTDGARDAGILVNRPSGRRPYMVDVLPLQGPPGWIDVTRTCCLLVIEDLAEPQPRAEANLRDQFGLTAAEAAVAVRVGCDGNLASIAEGLGVGLATVRTHLAHALEKTGLHRQSELARLSERLGGVVGNDEPPPPNR